MSSQQATELETESSSDFQSDRSRLHNEVVHSENKEIVHSENKFCLLDGAAPGHAWLGPLADVVQVDEVICLFSSRNPVGVQYALIH